MSTKLNFSICQSSDCKSLVFKDLTGTYNNPNNLTGWGSPNEDIADYHYSKIEFFLSGVLIKTFEFFNITFPTNDTSFKYTLPYAIADGIYTIKYTVLEDADSISGLTISTQQAFYCNTKCCVQSMFKDIDHTCDCSKDKIEKAKEAWVLYKGLEANSGCGNIPYFNNVLAQVNKACKNSNCSNCK